MLTHSIDKKYVIVQSLTATMGIPHRPPLQIFLRTNPQRYQNFRRDVFWRYKFTDPKGVDTLYHDMFCPAVDSCIDRCLKFGC